MRSVVKEIRNEHNALIQHEVVTSTEGNSSVEITVDAKGMVKPTVKVYNDDIEICKLQALKIWNELKDNFGDKMLGEKSITT